MNNGQYLNRLLPNRNAATMDAADRGEKTVRCLTAFSGYYEPERDGKIYPTDFRHTKRAIAVSKCGSKMAR